MLTQEGGLRGIDAASKPHNLQLKPYGLAQNVHTLNQLDATNPFLSFRSIEGIVFVTAYPQHATKAFDIGAVDYIVKAIDTDRLHLAIDRVERNIRQGHASLTQQELRSAIELLKQALPRSTYQTRVLVPNGARHTFVDVNEIDWVEAADITPVSMLVAQSFCSVKRLPNFLKHWTRRSSYDCIVQLSSMFAA